MGERDDENEDDCKVEGDEVRFGEIDREEDSGPNLDKNNGGGGILRGKTLIFVDSWIPQGRGNWLQDESRLKYMKKQW